MEVKLSRNAWHYKLQQYIWGSNMPNYFSLCPYFWMTILSMIIAIPVTSVKLIWKLFSWVEDEILFPRLDRWLANLSPEEAFLIEYQRSGAKKKMPFTFSYFFDFSSWHLLDRWKDKRSGTNEYWDDLTNRLSIDEDNARYRLNKLKEEKAKRNSHKVKRNAKIMNGLIKFTKKLVAVLITLAITYLLTWSILLIVVNFNGSASWDMLKFIVIVVTGICVFFAFVTFLVYIVTESLDFLLDKIFSPIGRGFSAVFGVFIEYFKVAKNETCPSINWDED